MCRHRFGVLNDLSIELQNEGINDVSFIGINGYQYVDDDYSLMIEGREVPWTQDYPEVDVWREWDVILRDLYILDRNGTLITKINLTSYNPDPNSTCGQNYDVIKNVILNSR